MEVLIERGADRGAHPDKIASLLVDAHSNGYVSGESCMAVVNGLCSEFDDRVVDTPKLGSVLGTLLGVLIANKVIPLEYAAQMPLAKSPDLLPSLFKAMEGEMGKGQEDVLQVIAHTEWDIVDTLLPRFGKEALLRYFVENRIEYVYYSSAEKYLSKSLQRSQDYRQLLEQIRRIHPDPNCPEMCFCVTRAVLSTCIKDGAPHHPEVTLQRYVRMFTEIVAHNPPSMKAVLSATQKFCAKFKYTPPAMICDLFRWFKTNNVVLDDAFRAWYDDPETKEELKARELALAFISTLPAKRMGKLEDDDWD